MCAPAFSVRRKRQEARGGQQIAAISASDRMTKSVRGRCRRARSAPSSDAAGELHADHQRDDHQAERRKPQRRDEIQPIEDAAHRTHLRLRPASVQRRGATCATSELVTILRYAASIAAPSAPADFSHSSAMVSPILASAVLSAARRLAR